MIGFLCLLVGFLIGLFFGALSHRDGCVAQIKATGMLALKNKVYSLSEMEKKGEK